MQIFVINQAGVTSFSLSGADLQLDNVIYDPVPEPGSYALRAACLLAVLGAARLRNMAVR